MNLLSKLSCMGTVNGFNTKILQGKCIRKQRGNSESMTETIETINEDASQKSSFIK